MPPFPPLPRPSTSPTPFPSCHHPTPIQFPSPSSSNPTPPTHLLRRRHRPRVDTQLAMPHHLLNLPLLLKITQRLPRQGSIDLQPIDERGNGDEAVRLDIFVQFVGGGFVEDDGVVGFVFDFSFRPLLLLFLAGRCCCGCHDCVRDAQCSRNRQISKIDIRRYWKWDRVSERALDCDRCKQSRFINSHSIERPRHH